MDGGQDSGVPTSRLYVGNLSWRLDNGGLQQYFAQFGPSDARVIFDRVTGRSKGFGFVTFPDEATATQAMTQLNNSEMDGRTIRVSYAQPQAPREGGMGGGGGGGGFGGGGGGGFNRDSFGQGQQGEGRGFGAFGGGRPQQGGEGGGSYGGGGRGGYGGGGGGGGSRGGYGGGGGNGGY